ncbi:MAG: hypothetical protein ACAI25_20045 [Planctomycetota bacterium]
MRLRAVLLLVLVLGCASEPRPATESPNETPPPADKPAERKPPRHTWDDDEIRRIDFPEPMGPKGQPGAAPVAAAKKTEPARPNVKLALVVYDVISWEDVKVRGGLRGSPVRGVVSLTGWLAKAKSASRTETVVAAGREGQLDVAEAVRSLTGGTPGYRVAVLDSNEKGELEVAVSAVGAPGEEAQVAAATRVRLGAGEALVVGGHRSEEGETPKVDRLVLIEASPKK